MFNLLASLLAQISIQHFTIAIISQQAYGQDKHFTQIIMALRAYYALELQTDRKSKIQALTNLFNVLAHSSTGNTTFDLVLYREGLGPKCF